MWGGDQQLNTPALHSEITPVIMKFVRRDPPVRWRRRTHARLLRTKTMLTIEMRLVAAQACRLHSRYQLKMTYVDALLQHGPSASFLTLDPLSIVVGDRGEQDNVMGTEFLFQKINRQEREKLVCVWHGRPISATHM